jgi:hypothetical protein
MEPKNQLSRRDGGAGVGVFGDAASACSQAESPTATAT